MQLSPPNRPWVFDRSPLFRGYSTAMCAAITSILVVLPVHFGWQLSVHCSAFSSFLRPSSRERGSSSITVEKNEWELRKLEKAATLALAPKEHRFGRHEIVRNAKATFSRGHVI